jgi:hypothetical protein
MDAMTSRERIAAALQHCESDRVPIDLGTCDTTIAREVYEGLAALLGVEPTAAVDVPHPGEFVVPDEETLKALGADVRHVKLSVKATDDAPAEQRPKKETLPDGTVQWTHANGTVYRRPAGGSDIQMYRPAITGELTAAEVDRLYPPAPQ